MKSLLPDTIAAQAMVLLVVGLAFTHLVSNVFYATDRESALLAAGGEDAILWVATAGAFASTVSSDEWAEFARVATGEDRFVTFTSAPVVGETGPGDWHGVTLQRELSRQVPADRLENYRIAYVRRGSEDPALAYWQAYLADRGQDVPEEMILVSLRLDNGNWLNAACRIKPAPPFFSASLGLSMAVMLIFVVLISLLIVRRMTAPLKEMSLAAQRLGVDVRGPSIPERGPLEVRRAARAFNGMQSRIRRFVRDRTQMLGAIAHDLGTPITRLRLRAEFVEEKELRGKMLRDLDDMEQMVASTLAFIREDAASEPRTRVDVGSLLLRVCDDLTDGGARVEPGNIPRGVLLECHPVGLRRALSNLIGNAASYGSCARVDLERRGEDLLVHVRDRGPGIPDDLQEDVFRPFFRLEDSRNRETGGAGLGLAVARNIVRAHGGDITLRNRAGGGLCVSVRLPLAVWSGRSGEVRASPPAAPG